MTLIPVLSKFHLTSFPSSEVPGFFPGASQTLVCRISCPPRLVFTDTVVGRFSKLGEHVEQAVGSLLRPPHMGGGRSQFLHL